MIAISKTSKGSLLAAVALVIVAMCAVAVIAPGAAADGDDGTSGYVPIVVPAGATTIDEDFDWSNITAGTSYVIEKDDAVTVTDGFTLPAGASLYIQGSLTISDEALSFDERKIAGDVYVLDGGELTFDRGILGMVIERTATVTVEAGGEVGLVIDSYVDETIISNENKGDRYNPTSIILTEGTLTISGMDLSLPEVFTQAANDTVSVNGTDTSILNVIVAMLWGTSYEPDVVSEVNGWIADQISKIEADIVVDGKAQINDISSNPSSDGQNFTLDVDWLGESMYVTVAEGSELELNTEEGTVAYATIVNNGTIRVTGSFEGTIDNKNGTIIITESGDASGLTITRGGTLVNNSTANIHPSMDDRTLYSYNGYDYVVFTYVYRSSADPTDVHYYQYGLAVNDILFQSDMEIMDNDVSVIPVNLPTVGQSGTIRFSNTDNYWYDSENGSYEGALKAETDDGYPAGSAGLYTGVIRWTATGTEEPDDGDAKFDGISLTQYLDLRINPATVDGKFDIDPVTWKEYDIEADDIEVTLDLGTFTGYTASFTVSDGDTVYTSIASLQDHLAGLGYGKYTVTVTVSGGVNFTVNLDKETIEITVTKDAEESKLEFHSLEDYGGDIGDIIDGLTLEDLQEYVQYQIKFWDSPYASDDTIVSKIVTGSMYKVIDDTTSTTDVWDILSSYFDTTTIADETTDGYFLAFYVTAEKYDISDWTAEKALSYILMSGYLDDEGDEVLNIVDITRESDDEYTALENTRFYLIYIEADYSDYLAGEADGSYGFTTDSDFDADGSEWTEVDYDIDLSFLNFYGIIYHDDTDHSASGFDFGDEYYNDTFVLWRSNGDWIWTPSGAGANFSYWATESETRVAYSNSVFFVGEKYDTDGDMIINLWSVYGETGSGDTGGDGGDVTETFESENILVAPTSTATGVDIYFVALDGGYVPAGTFTVTFYYTYVEDGISGMDYYTFEVEITEDAAGQSIVIVSVDLQSVAGEYFDAISYVEASYGDFQSERIVYSR